MNSHYGKHIWIVGASSGIGRALAIELHAQGAHLILSARNAEALEQLNQELDNKHIINPVDVTDTKDLNKIAESIETIDSVIFMAALYDPAPLDQLNIDTAHKMVAVNVNGALNTIHAVLPKMKKHGSGQIALCGSVAGYRGLPNGQPYSATKAAIINLAESLRAEEPELDIKLISPGFVRTPLTDKNDFKMPMMIEAEDAAKIIAKDLLSRKFEIHFPKRFTIIMKLVGLLPRFLYFMLLGVMQKKG